MKLQTNLNMHLCTLNLDIEQMIEDNIFLPPSTDIENWLKIYVKYSSDVKYEDKHFIINRSTTPFKLAINEIGSGSLPIDTWCKYEDESIQEEEDMKRIRKNPYYYLIIPDPYKTVKESRYVYGVLDLFYPYIPSKHKTDSEIVELYSMYNV